VPYAPQNEGAVPGSLSICDRWLIVTPRFHAVLCSTDGHLAHFLQRASSVIQFATFENLSSFVRSFQPVPVHKETDGTVHDGIDDDMHRAIGGGMRMSAPLLAPYVQSMCGSKDEALSLARRVVSAINEAQSSNSDDDIRDVLSLYPSAHNISLARRLRQHQRGRADCELFAHEVVRLNRILMSAYRRIRSQTPSSEVSAQDTSDQDDASP
jgi:hypothetical protein